MLVPVDRTAEFSLLLQARLSTKGDGVDEKGDAAIFYRHETHGEADDNINNETNDLSKRISSMSEVIANSRRRYMDFSSPRGMKDSERDALDGTLGEFLQAAMAHIDMLKGTTSGGDAHELGAILILSERLQVIASESEALRAVRISHAMKGGGRSNRNVQIDTNNMALPVRPPASKGEEEEDKNIEEMGGVDVQQFAEENAVLVADLVETRERVREAEKNVIEIANLNHIFAAKVLEQAKEIENLYELAVDSNHYLDYGNRELLAMKGKRNRLQYGLSLIIVILSLFLLALDFTLHR